MKSARPLAAALCVFTSISALSQAPSGLGTGRVPDRRITLDVAVTDKSGISLSGLHQEDFTVLDNKRPQLITSFHPVTGGGKPGDPPVRVVFVIDEVNSSFRAISDARVQLEKYLRQNGGQLPVPMSLVVFNEKTTQVQGMPTRDGNLLANSVQAIAAGAPRDLEGAQFENQIWRIQISMRALGKLLAYEATQPGRKLLIWLGAGWTVITDSADKLGNKDLETDFETLVKLSSLLRDAHVSLYSVDPLGTDDAAGLGSVYYQNFLEGVPSAKKFRSGNLALGVIAVQSGGLVLNRNNDVAALIRRCVEDANSYYSLTFDSDPAGHPNEYHDVQVRIGKAGVVARTRTGYYAQP